MNINYCRSLELRHDVGVFIAGGGPSGCAAAIAAAKAGADVFIAEAQYSFGGQGTSGLVPAFMCLDDGENFLAGGVARDILERMWKIGGGNYEKSRPHAIKVEALKRAYDELVAESGARFTFGAQLCDVKTEGGRISHCVLAAKSGMYAVRAKVYIDCTGDADLAYMAGAPCEKGDENGNMMAGTLCSLWAGIDWARRKGPQNKEIERAAADGVFKKPDKHLPGFWKISDRIGGGNIGHTFGVDGTDERSITEAIAYGRRLYDQYEQYYKKYLEGYEDMELVITGAMLGIRETRRVRGAYRLCLDDFLNRAVFPDEIGRYAYPVDIHASDNSAASFDKFLSEHTGYRYGKGESYGIPYRCLLPDGAENLLVAGRCISADRAMQSSIRVMPGCFLTGQAAGTAAAQCVKKGVSPRDADIMELQRALKANDTFLPNFAE